MNKRISEALVQHLQQGSSKSASNMIKVCHEENQPDFDDGQVLKEVFQLPEFEQLVAQVVERQLGDK